MTYNVFSGTLNPTHLLTYLLTYLSVLCFCSKRHCLIAMISGKSLKYDQD